MDPHRLLILLGHPNPSSFNAALAQAYLTGARQGGASADLLSLADLSFDPILRPRGPHDPGAPGDRGRAAARQLLEPDLRRAQAAIERSAHLTIVFPVWWGGLPALLKGFIDRTFLPGWAYEQPARGLPVKRLVGRSASLVMTMDAPGWYDRAVYRRSAQRALANATLRYVGFSRVRTTVLSRIRQRTDAQRETMLERIRTLGARDAAALQRRNKPAVSGDPSARIEAGYHSPE